MDNNLVGCDELILPLPAENAKLVTLADSMRIKYINLLVCVLSPLIGISQIQDDFTDGDFTLNPTWTSSDASGNGADFTISSGELRSAGPSNTSALSISTSAIPDMTANDMVWTFKARYGSGSSAPSSSNNIRIYLVADNADLSSVSSGYYIQLGESLSGDGIDLFEVGNSTALIEDGGDQVAAGINVNIRVTRSSTGEWSMSADVTGGTSFVEVGSYSESGIPNSGTHFGFVVNHTSSNNDNFYFDDVSITATPVADSQAPELSSFEVQGSDQILLSFSEEVDQLTSETVTNYVLSPSISTAQAEQQVDPTQMLLTFSSDFSSGTDYTLNVINVEDGASNAISDTSLSFFYVEFSDPSFRDIVINELHPDPGNNNLPNAEYIELYNTTDTKYFKTDLLKVKDESGTEVALPTDTLGPNEYLLLVSDTSLFSSSLNKLPVSVPSLNNSGDIIYLLSTSDTYLDSLVYESSDDNSIEQINPTIGFFLEENYGFSTDGDGGTPGQVNAIFDDTPDTSPPQIEEVIVISDNSIKLVFDEKLDEVSAENISNFLLTEESAVPNVASLSDDLLSITLTFSSAFTSGKTQSIEVSNVEDLFGNDSDETETFTYYLIATPEQNDVLINEFLVAPNESEFIELYNNSDHYFNLDGWIIEDETGNQLTLSDWLFEPKSLVVITSSSGVDSMQVSGFPLLNNSSDSIILRYSDHSEIYRVGYDNYEEGKSHELINPSYTCKGIYNYEINEVGNTAGATNTNSSTEEDTDGPVVTHIEVISKDSVVISFDEPLMQDQDFLSVISIGSQAPAEVSLSTSVVLSLKLSEALIDEKVSQMTIGQIKDCIGNNSDAGNYELYIDGTPPQPQIIRAIAENELMVTFQENLENITNADLDKFGISGLILDEIHVPDSSQSMIIMGFEQSFIEDSTYNLEITGLEDTLGNALSDNYSFFYADDLQELIIRSANTIDLLFKEELNFDKIETASFWISSGQYPSSAHATDSMTIRLKFDHPLTENKDLRLYMNSIYTVSNELLATPAEDFYYDTDAPELTNILVLTADSIFLDFSEDLNPSIAINPLNYTIDGNLFEHILLTDANTVLLIPQSLLTPEAAYELSYQYIEDLNGNSISSKKEVLISFDTLAPQIDQAYQFSLDEVAIVSHERLDTAIGNASVWYEYEENIYPGALNYLSETQVMVRFPDSIPQIQELKIGVSGWADLYGNVIQDSIYFSIDTETPQLVDAELISNYELALRFNHKMSSDILDTTIYMVGKDHISTIEQIDDWYLLSAQKNFEIGETYQLSFGDVYNDMGVSIQTEFFSFTYESFLLEIELRAPDNFLMIFSEDLPVLGSLNVELSSLEVDYQGVNPNETSEYEVHMTNSIPDNESILISWDSVRISFEEVIPAGSQTIFRDTQSPQILTVENGFFNQLQVEYTEEVTEEPAIDPSNYLIEGEDYSIEVALLSPSKYLVTFDTLISGSPYELIIFSQLDLAGNETTSDTLTFNYDPPELPLYGELVITEIMFDPSPPVGLPETEYIEIYNASVHDIDLKGLKMSDASGSYGLPHMILPSENYLVLAGSNDSLFTFWEEMPSLSNSGESIRLETVYGQIVDSLTYDDLWITEIGKREGGYSLEIINLTSACKGPANWDASIDTTGGTPGRANSIADLAPDIKSPLVTGADLLDSTSLRISFSEYMDTTYHEAGFSSIQFNGLETVTLTLDSVLLEGQINQITIDGFFDCSGNALLDTIIDLPYPRQPFFGEIAITEIMPDPTPEVGLSDAEYIELHNLTSDVLSLDSIQINGIPLYGFLLPSGYITLVPSSYQDYDLYENARGLSPWIGLANTRDTLILSVGNQILMELIYDDTWYGAEEKAAGGYSLEIMAPNLICDSKENWGASIEIAGGTPGKQNSLFESKSDESKPQILDIQPSELFLHVVFDEIVIGSQINWKIDPALTISASNSITQLSNEYQLSLSDSPTYNEEYRLLAIGLEDCYGNHTDSLEYSFLLPESSIDELFINEVLFDPLSGGDDFVELYNGSADRFIQLGQLFWSLEGDFEPLVEDLVLGPQEYIALTTNRPQLLFDFPDADPNQVKEVSRLPSMPNDEGHLVIVDGETKILDSVYYHRDYHSPLLDNAEGVSLERLSIDYPAVESNNWASGSSLSGFATPGKANSQQISQANATDPVDVEPRTFIPGSSNPGLPSRTTITFKNEKANRLANIWIIDANGRQVKTLGQGLLLGTESFVTWDGTNDRGAHVQIGQYLLIIEFYGGGTQSEVHKKPITVGGQF
jgi:hypothetical protein